MQSALQIERENLLYLAHIFLYQKKKQETEDFVTEKKNMTATIANNN